MAARRFKQRLRACGVVGRCWFAKVLSHRKTVQGATGLDGGPALRHGRQQNRIIGCLLVCQAGGQGLDSLEAGWY